MPAKHRLPAPRLLTAAGLTLVVLLAAWLHGHDRRKQLQSAAATVAGQIAGRQVSVNCPGPIERRLFYEIHEGSVRFGSDGRPSSQTNLSARTCAGLRRALDDGPSLQLDCLAHNCPPDGERVAAALAVLAHEAVHLRGVVDEGATECEARAQIALVAHSFGLSRRSVQALAYWQRTDWADSLPDRYRSC